MNFADAFKETLFRYKLKGSDIAEKAGMTTPQISQFRNGRNIRIDGLQRILAAMPADARRYLLNLVAEDPMHSAELPASPEETESELNAEALQKEPDDDQ